MPHSPSASPSTILVVEDDRVTRNGLAYILQHAGFTVWQAGTAAEARRLVEQQPDLILLDVGLPDANGYDFCGRIKGDLKTANVSILLLSGLGTHTEERVRGLESGADGYLAKPVEPTELVAQVKSLFRLRRAEQGLARDALLLANVRDSIIVTDPDGIVTYWNEGATRLFGWTASELMGRLLTDRVPEAARARMAAATRAIATGEEFAGEWEDYRKDGSRVWIDARVSRITDSAGKTIGILGIAHDVTARKLIEAERDELLARLRIQIDRMPMGYVFFDADLRVIDWNATAERIFGYSKQEVLGMAPPFEKILPPSAWPQGDALLRRLRSGDMTAHAINENITKDGRTIICEWYNTPLLSNDGVFLGLVSLAQDITGRRHAEEALLLRDRAIQAVSSGILITDPNQQNNPIIYASPGFEQLTQYSASEVLGRNCRFLQGPSTDPATIALLRAAIREGRPCTVELLNYKKDGTPFWNALSISPVRDDQGGLSHFVGVQSDVTERRKLEERYRQSQRMEAIGQLAGGIAHDFNNLLTVINGYGEILRATLPAENLLRESAGEIVKAGERAAALTRQLLAFSRQQMLAPRIVNLNTVVIDLEKMLRRVIGEDIDLATRLQADLAPIRADPGQLEQVLLNLAVNARDAMPKGGKLTVATSNVRLDREYATAHPGAAAGKYALLTVSDTGVGMAPEVRARVFEPFFTTKAPGKGTGLGLATVHGIVVQSGGRIDLYSEPGHGTTFKVYLPCVEGAVVAGRSHAGKSLALAPRGVETVLVAEDEASVRALSCHVLQSCGYTVLEARDGEEALTVCERERGNIRLLISDVVMPGLGGRALAERLRAKYPELRVLYLSGYTDDAIVRHGVLEAEVHFLQKPFSPAELARKVREVLDS